MELQTAALEDLGGTPNYQAWLSSLVLPYLGDDPIEIGSGTGDYAQLWLDGGLARITLTELDPSRRALLEKRFADDDRVEIVDLDLQSPADGHYSCLLSFNVLEHVLDDGTALRASAQVLRPGGYVFHLVPAFPFALSRFDREIGHFRRYRRESLRALAADAGLDVVDVRYLNAPGLIAWFVMMRLLRQRPRKGPMLKVWDSGVIAIESRIERRVRVPFGQSAILIARTPRGPEASDSGQA